MAMTLADKKQTLATAIDYYRKRPDVFCEEVLEIKLNIYQKIMMRAFFSRSFHVWVMSRGLGKTWLGVLCIVVYCLLYPNTKAGIIAPSFRQAKNALQEKYKGELCEKSPFLAQEEKSFACSLQKARVEFYNGSWIEAYPIGNDGSKIRGARLHVVLIDESAYLNRELIDKVINPMLVVKGRYEVGKKDDGDGNKILMTSSASYRNNHLYQTFINWTKEMVKPNSKYFTMTLPYQIGLSVGLFEESIVEKAKIDMSSAEFEMEYLGRFPRLVDGSWIKYDDLMACKDIQHIETKGVENFEYIMSLDVARMKGGDNTICQVWKMEYYKNHMEMYCVYIMSMNGLQFSEQNKRIRELLNRFPQVVRLIMDCNGLGVGLADELAKPYYNKQKDEWEKPLVDMNDKEAMKQIEKTGGRPLIFGIKPNLEINHLMGYAVKKYSEKQWIHFYSDNADEDSDLTLEQETLLQETKITISEVLNVVTRGISSGWLQFMTRGKRKDRWSATGMAVYGADLLWQEKNNDDGEGQFLISVARR